MQAIENVPKTDKFTAILILSPFLQNQLFQKQKKSYLPSLHCCTWVPYTWPSTPRTSTKVTNLFMVCCFLFTSTRTTNRESNTERPMCSSASSSSNKVGQIGGSRRRLTDTRRRSSLFKCVLNEQNRIGKNCFVVIGSKWVFELLAWRLNIFLIKLFSVGRQVPTMKLKKKHFCFHCLQFFKRQNCIVGSIFGTY